MGTWVMGGYVQGEQINIGTNSTVQINSIFAWEQS